MASAEKLTESARTAENWAGLWDTVAECDKVVTDIEGRLPEGLVGTENERGDTIPERLFPIFRDEEELPADADLSTAIRAAVERSKYLIVLCSPRAAESTYVAEEIRYFKQLGRADRILAVLIEGEPNASCDEGKQRAGFSPFQECFPKPLMHPVEEDGSLDETQRAEPIAADLRIQDGR